MLHGSSNCCRCNVFRSAAPPPRATVARDPPHATAAVSQLPLQHAHITDRPMKKSATLERSRERKASHVARAESRGRRETQILNSPLRGSAPPREARLHSVMDSFRLASAAWTQPDPSGNPAAGRSAVETIQTSEQRGWAPGRTVQAAGTIAERGSVHNVRSEGGPAKEQGVAKRE